MQAVWLLCLLICLFDARADGRAGDTLWPDAGREARPGTYWWWMGSAVDSAGLRSNLSQLAQAGIGGVLVIPIYGAKGYEDRFINYLSPRWMRMLNYASSVAESLGMWVDMTTGTGWPFGGSHVAPEYAAKKLLLRTFGASPRRPVEVQFEPGEMCAVVAYGGRGEREDLSGMLGSGGLLRWRPEKGSWVVVALMRRGTGQKVKRAAPGNAGLVLDPFSPEAMHFYLQRFDSAFALSGAPFPRAQYHDSYEYFGANWTDRFLSEFYARRGYRLEDVLCALGGRASADSVARVKADYRRTLAELHLEYIRTWVDWAHARGSLTRNEAHGAPANLLDLYAAADIPETETFGSTPFPIPGLRRSQQNVREDEPDPVILRFASSAAHVTGRRLVASETCTWLREHFKTALSQVKPEIDQLFLAGINHIFYHGAAYSPGEAPWPGWLFYASVAFQPANSIWRDFPALNAYVTRCQSVLQSGLPDDDVLLYWPLEDIWHDTSGYQIQLTVHRTEWVDGHPYGELAAELLRKGFTFDFTSDSQLGGLTVEDGALVSGGARFAALLVPECRYIPLFTWRRLEHLARWGATILFHRALPQDVPGLALLERRREALREAQRKLRFVRKSPGLLEAALGRGRFVLSKDIDLLLAAAGVAPEAMAHHWLQFIRRRLTDGCFYFVANLGRKPVDTWVSLSRPGRAMALLDPLTGEVGLAATRRDSNRLRVHLQVAPGQSLILRTLERELPDLPGWSYYHCSGMPVKVGGRWRVEFIRGGPVLPETVEIDTLRSWTELGDPEMVRFAGTARYTVVFEMPPGEADDWLLDLGDVRESARVKLNGVEVGTVWCLPFAVRVGRFLRPGWNTLEVEVTNLSANRIRDLDRRGLPWKRFYDINFVNIRYRPFDASSWEPVPSGLLGPVRLVPLRRFNPLDEQG